MISMRQLFYLILLVILTMPCVAQQNISTPSENNATFQKQPKLVVGIVVDQMRYDYLTRFYNKYGEGGFKRMMNEGFNCENHHFNYIPTYTGPGHASIYTGTTPKYHGIIANDWYDKSTKKSVYCAGDNTVESIGTTDDAGKMSPHRMVATTFADENKLFTQMKGKTIGISIKDRGAILPAGHTANAAYWFHGKDEGIFISSSFYMKELPQWVKKFNESNVVESYFREWNTLYNINTYTESGSDLNDFEEGFKGKETATFPYDLKALKETNGGFDILKTTPFGNSLTADFAIMAIEGEQLGQDTIPDVLTVSFSSPDYIGHNFGVNSKEIEDTYLRLDLDLERLFTTLDEKVGIGEYTVFLTADHGAVHVPSYLESVKIPAGYVNNKSSRSSLEAFLKETFGSSDLIENISNNQIFLNKTTIKSLDLDLDDVEEAIANEVIHYEDIFKVYSATTMNQTSFSGGIEHLLQNGFNQKRSGDILLVGKPGFISYHRKGTTHGSGYNYDTHVPLLFFGKGIAKGHTLKKTAVSDISPTISALLGISFPNSSITGNPLEFVLE